MSQPRTTRTARTPTGWLACGLACWLAGGAAFAYGDDWLSAARGAGRARFQAIRYQEEVVPTPAENEVVPGPGSTGTGPADSNGNAPAPQPGTFRLGEPVPAMDVGEEFEGAVIAGGPVRYGCPFMFDSENGEFFAGADYLYARPTFSEATAFARVDHPAEDSRQELLQHGFGYSATPRISAGYRRLDTGGEVRFTYTNFAGSSRRDSVRTPDDLSTIFIVDPELQTREDEKVVATSHLDTNVYDVELLKTIPIAPGNPGLRPLVPWEITFLAGARVADIEWASEGTILDEDDDVRARGVTTLFFNGAGPRVGIQGRRYFGQQARWSLFARGNLSLLIGHYELVSRTLEFDINDFDTSLLVRKRTVPVTEIELGASVNIRGRTTISAGYLFHSWHDIGMPQQVAGKPFGDSNILSFDGLFMRGELSY